MKGTCRTLWAGALLLVHMHSIPIYAQGDTESLVQLARVNPSAWLDRTLEQRFRPTLAEIIPVLQNCPTCRARLEAMSPLSFFDEASSRDYRQIIRVGGPKLIAFLEGVYPNGTYAFLGRDVLILSDVIEAFYMTQLVPSPVARLNASVATITELTDRQRGVEFLRTYGLDLEQAALGQKPFVLIDRTHYTPRSQTVKLLRAVLRSTDDLNLRASLRRYVNVIGTNSGKVIDFVPNALERLHSDRLNKQNLVELDIALPFLLRAPGCDGLTDVERIAWHSPFSGVLIELKDGRLSGLPGSQTSLHERLTTLRYMWDLFQIVSEPEFFVTARNWATGLGVDLSKQVEGRKPACATNLVASRGAA